MSEKSIILSYKAVQLRQQGLTYRQIGAVLGVSHQAAWLAVKRWEKLHKVLAELVENGALAGVKS